MQTKIKSNIESVSEGVSFIEEQLVKYKVKPKKKIKAMFLSEELLLKLINESEDTSDIGITVKKFLSTVTIKINKRGKEVDFASGFSGFGFNELDQDMDPGTESAIQAVIIRAFMDKLRISYKNGVNRVGVVVGDPTQKRLFITIGAFISAILLGILLRLFMPSAINMGLDSYVLTPIKTMFLNALKMVMAPMIFFSIASCVASFGDISELGKIGGKIMGYFVASSMIAISLAYGITKLVNPGEWGSLAYMASGVSESGEGVSILNTIINIVPDSMAGSFHTGDTLQIMFMAVLAGIACGAIGESSSKVSTFLNCANDLFLQISMLITRLLPLMIFCSMCSMVLTLDVANFGAIGSMVLCIFMAFIGMVAIYMLYVFLRVKKGPKEFMSLMGGAWVNAMMLSSSNAAIPGTMENCNKKMGISPKVYSFSVPFGANLNMDGVAIVLTVAALFLANVFGITVGSSELFTLFITVTLLSMGAPGIPGGALLCMSVLLQSLGIPVEGISLIAGIFSVLDPLTAGIDVLGDVVGTYVVAKKSGMCYK